MTAPDDASKRRRPTGRRIGDSGTRDAILDAARDLFAERGYDKASVRAIAARAGVDPGLIRHFFVDKDGLFAATMADRTVVPQRLAEALRGDPTSLGVRIADAYLGLWEEDATRPILLGLVRSATTSRRGADMLIEILSSGMRGSIPVPAPDSPRARGMALAGSHLFGVAVARHVIRLPIIADLTREELVAAIAPSIQRYLDGTSGAAEAIAPAQTSPALTMSEIVDTVNADRR